MKSYKISTAALTGRPILDGATSSIEFLPAIPCDSIVRPTGTARRPQGHYPAVDGNARLVGFSKADTLQISVPAQLYAWLSDVHGLAALRPKEPIKLWMYHGPCMMGGRKTPTVRLGYEYEGAQVCLRRWTPSELPLWIRDLI